MAFPVMARERTTDAGTGMDSGGRAAGSPREESVGRATQGLSAN